MDAGPRGSLTGGESGWSLPRRTGQIVIPESASDLLAGPSMGDRRGLRSSARDYLRPTASQSGAGTGVDPQRFVAAAVAVGERIAELAQVEDGRVSWVGVTRRGDTLAAAPLGLSLYDGLTGVALFLAELGALTDESRFTTLARTTVETIQRRLEAEAALERSIGAFKGWGGLIYTFARLGSLWNDRSLHVAAERMLRPVRRIAAGAPTYDISAGLAGAVAGLLALQAATGSSPAMALAVRCGGRLIEEGERTEQGLSWPSPLEERGPLGGFAHGAGGISWALHLLAQANGGARFERAALEADAFQQQLLSSAARLRDLPASEPGRAALDASMPLSMLESWSWGAAGVGLSWARSGRLLGERRPGRHLDLALRLVLARRSSDDDTLSHGTLGDLDLLLEAAHGLRDPELLAEAHRRALAVAATGSCWRCPSVFGAESPGLMTGLSGIGYGLLRAAAPEVVPSVLLLDPPRSRRSDPTDIPI